MSLFDGPGQLNQDPLDRLHLESMVADRERETAELSARAELLDEVPQESLFTSLWRLLRRR